MDPAWRGLAWREDYEAWCEADRQRQQEAVDAEERALWEERQSRRSAREQAALRHYQEDGGLEDVEDEPLAANMVEVLAR